MTLDQIIKRGLELGLEAVEVYASTTESNSLKLDEGKLESYSMKELFSVSIRGLKNGKMANVVAESLDDQVIESLLQALARNVDQLDATEPEFMFEGGSTYQPVEELKSNYKDYTVADKVALLKKLESACLAVSDKIVKVGYCQYSETARKVQLKNSKGLDLSQSYSYISTFVGPLAAQDGQTAVGISGDINTDFNAIEVDRMIAESTQTALDQLGAGSIETGKYPVVFKRDVASEILSAFSSVFLGDSALRKMTILTDKVGQKVFGENITICDDPFCDVALIKSSFDDEGVPCVSKKVVENGVFNGFMHTLKTANFFGQKPTGNGFKSGGGAISAQPTNMYLQQGSLTKDEIIATVEDGIYVTDVGGLHAGLNPISGDFNVQGSGFVIKNGKIDRPITLFVVSGNFYEMMNNVDHIGNDIEKRFVGVACPTLKIKSLAISGK
ncbi:MAG: TldD/PmbA family protein [Clostridia bacterium]|nr:TldD/PmbA family protein [Clostridia bacterium]